VGLYVLKAAPDPKKEPLQEGWYAANAHLFQQPEEKKPEPMAVEVSEEDVNFETEG
jgi:hypothetical protein